MPFRRGIPLTAFLISMSVVFGATPGRGRQKIEYAEAAGVPLFMDAAVPEGSGPFPAAIILHGGAWITGDRRIDVEPLFRPLTTAGFAWFSIDYRLTPDISQFGDGIGDVQSAIRFVKAHATDYHIDPDRLALIGESAGGQLAAMAALNPAPDTSVKAVVALYAPTDLVQLAKNSSFVPQQLRDALRGTPFEAMILARLGQLSPVDNVRSGAPPFLLIHGTADTLVPFSQSRAMCDRMTAAGASCELFPVQGGGHGIRWWESAHPHEAEAYKQKMVQWLREQMAANPARPRG